MCCEKKSGKMVPSMDQWMREAKCHPDAEKVGMYLTHNGVVRGTARALVRNQEKNTGDVTGMTFSYNEEKLSEIVEEVREREGIYYVRVWLNEGELSVGEDIMYVLIGGDIRPHVIEALDHLVGRIKSECVMEKEHVSVYV